MCAVVITVIPLSKMYYTNSEYYAAANLNAIEKKFNIKTYEADDFVPEIIWDYGNYIPQLKYHGNIIMPAENHFGLLGDAAAVKELQQKFGNYNFQQYATVDLNVLSKNEKGYNERIVKNYYIVQKR